MSEAAITKTAMTMMFGVIFIGGAAAIFEMYRAAQETERIPGCVIHENDGETFIYGANA